MVPYGAKGFPLTQSFGGQITKKSLLNVVLLLVHCICAGVDVGGGVGEKRFPTSLRISSWKTDWKKHYALLCLDKQESAHPDLVVPQRLPGSLQSLPSAAETAGLAEPRGSWKEWGREVMLCRGEGVARGLSAQLTPALLSLWALSEIPSWASSIAKRGEKSL